MILATPRFGLSICDTGKIVYIVKTHGWQVMKVMPKAQDQGWAFTNGLSRMFEIGC